MTTQRLRTALVGIGGMGLKHATNAAKLPEFEIVACCDMKSEQIQTFLDYFPDARGYTDYTRMLTEQRPDVVIVATSTASHAPLTIQAAESGVRGVWCEKPMATSLGEGRAMLEACERNGTSLVINHQRRTYPVFVRIRQLMDEGAIGQIELIRGSCAGDILSDGTHLIDTIRYLAGDADVRWVLGQVYRDPVEPSEAKSGNTRVSGGWRYGHPVETGGFALIEFTSGLRAEIHTGAVQVKQRRYQDYEIFGRQGRLHRAGDIADPALLIHDQQAGGWRPVEISSAGNAESTFQRTGTDNFHQFAQMILHGADHPLSGASGFKDLELVMAIYESARLHARLPLPLQQERFPLELMLEAGQFEQAAERTML